VTGRKSARLGGFVLAVCAALAACSSARQPTRAENSPGLVFPAHFAEGEEQDGGARKREPKEPPKRSTAPPDPEPLRQAEQYEYTFEYETGATRFVGVRALKFREPVVTARKMGRFAVELWVGSELVDRVRFDFPLLAAEAPPPKKRRPLDDPPSLTGGTLRATVLVPAAWRARRAVLVDRATDRETELDWPPRFEGGGASGAASAEPIAAPAGSAAPAASSPAPAGSSRARPR
jgi:hypothetical protein